jgi:hypothetical protein
MNISPGAAQDLEHALLGGEERGNPEFNLVEICPDKDPSFTSPKARAPTVGFFLALEVWFCA